MTHQPMFNSKRLGWTLAATAAAVLAPTAPRAVEITAGDWKFSATGNVNAHYITSRCEDGPTPLGVAGGLACVASPGQDRTSASVSNGLLPAALAISASTTQSGYDLAATFGFYPGISTNDGSPNIGQGVSPSFQNTALGTTAIDMRQVFLTFGNDSMGTFLLGRNIGLFGADAILGDMTLLGVGTVGSNAAPTNTSLGSIGLGYIYTDWLAQIDYTTPNISGFKFTIGVFDPLEPTGLATPGPGPTTKSSPGFHGKVAWTVNDNLYFSASGLSQKQKGSTTALGVPLARDFDSWAFDIGGKYKIAGFEVLGWYYKGSGVGTTALFFDASDGLGNERDSDGFLAQVTYTINKTKLGLNYGESKLDTASGEVAPGLVEKNSKYTFGVYHKLTENLTLLGEYTDTKAKNQAGGENKAQSFNVGAFLAF
jgi:predicted porin